MAKVIPMSVKRVVDLRDAVYQAFLAKGGMDMSESVIAHYVQAAATLELAETVAEVSKSVDRLGPI